MADNSGFVLAIAAFVEKAKAAPELVVRKVATDILRTVVERTPVGNPSTWKVNKVAVTYNSEVAAVNAAAREVAGNLTKTGRLKKGKKLNDGMDLVAPAGYVGGRLRANWNVQIGTPNRSIASPTDPGGEATIARGLGPINSWAGVGDIYIMNSMPYVRPIEYEGHSKQAPAGMVRLTVTEFQTFIDKAVQELPK